ncbi:MAG: YggT family protein [Cyanobacteria bacterium P01_H01_bin.119]
MNDRPRPDRPNPDPYDSYPSGHDKQQPEAEKQRLRQAEHQVKQSQQNAIAHKFEQGIYFLVGALELLLALRFILRLSSANPSNTFAGVIYGLSEPFVTPFSTLFISPTFNGSANIFDVNLLIAMISYLVLMFLVVWLIRIISTN